MQSRRRRSWRSARWWRQSSRRRRAVWRRTRQHHETQRRTPGTVPRSGVQRDSQRSEGMRRFIRTRSTANYRSALAALQRVSPLDPTLRVRRSMSRVLARRLLPKNLEPLTYAFEELLGESHAAARRLIHDWFFYRHLESASWTDPRHRPRSVLRDAARIGDYLSACPRGVLVATIHLGDYLEGLRQLGLAMSTTKRVLRDAPPRMERDRGACVRTDSRSLRSH